MVDEGGVLGEAQRVVQRSQRDGGAETDCRRDPGQRGEHEQWRREVPVVAEVVLTDPDGIESAPFGGDCGIDERVEFASGGVGGQPLSAQRSEADPNLVHTAALTGWPAG